jgi:uncharacterized protein YcfJ
MQYRLLLTLGLLTFTGVVEAHSKQYKVKVLDIEPVYQYVSIEKPVQYCSDLHHNATTSQTKRIIAGSVVGGTLGHLSSSRENRKNATLLGAVIGGVIGSQLGENSTYTKTSAQCITRYEQTEKVRVITGYHYWYKMKGHTYQAYSVDKPQPYITLRKK